MGDLRHKQIIEKLSNNRNVIGVYDFKQSQTELDLLKQKIPVAWTANLARLQHHRFVENLHKTSEESSHGIYHGANRTNGRWEESIALNFYLKHAHLSLDLKKDYNNFSLSIWHMQTGKLKKPLNNLVSLTNGRNLATYPLIYRDPAKLANTYGVNRICLQSLMAN